MISDHCIDFRLSPGTGFHKL